MKSSFFLTTLSLIFVLASFASVNAAEGDDAIPDVPEDGTLIDYQNYISDLNIAVNDKLNDMIRQAKKEGVDINSKTFKKSLIEMSKEYFVRNDKALDKAILLKDVPDDTFEKLVDLKFDSIKTMAQINNENERAVLLKMKAFAELLRKLDKTQFADNVELKRIQCIFNFYIKSGNVQEFEKAAVKVDNKIKNAGKNITPALAKMAILVLGYGFQFPGYEISKERIDFYCDALSNASDPKVKEMASYLESKILLIEGQKRVKTIVGKKIELTGTCLDGSEFNTKDCAGKILLIYIWGTCMGTEHHHVWNVRDLYKAYHDKGLEVIGIVLDNPEDNEKVKKCLEENGFTWKQMYESNAAISGYKCRDGKPITIVKYLGVEALPYLIILGTDGKVIALNLRHNELAEQIQKIFDERE